MKYRYWTEDVENGFTDFNDDHWDILMVQKSKDVGLVALIKGKYDFYVASNLEYGPYESIRWENDEDFSILDEAMDYFNKVVKGEEDMSIPDPLVPEKNYTLLHETVNSKYGRSAIASVVQAEKLSFAVIVGIEEKEGKFHFGEVIPYEDLLEAMDYYQRLR